MTPGMYLALARDIGIALALAFIVYRIYSAGENADAAADLKSLQAQIIQQGKTLDRWHQESAHANDQLSQDMATLRSAAATAKPPVWLCDDPASPRGKVLSSPAQQAGTPLPAAGGTVEGPRRDIRPQLEALKLKYESVLAECRDEDAQWPAQ